MQETTLQLQSRTIKQEKKKLRLVLAWEFTESSYLKLLIGWTCLNPKIFQRPLGLFKKTNNVAYTFITPQHTRWIFRRFGYLCPVNRIWVSDILICDQEVHHWARLYYHRGWYILKKKGKVSWEIETVWRNNDRVYKKAQMSNLCSGTGHFG